MTLQTTDDWMPEGASGLMENGKPYVAFVPGDRAVTLMGDFTIEQLRAMADHMGRNSERKQSYDHLPTR